MIKVLFVCLGNICRSPMAEAIFRQHFQDVFQMLDRSIENFLTHLQEKKSNQ